MVLVSKTSTTAGVSKGSRQPFNSMEINDQINGHEGTVLDDKAGVNDKIINQKVSNYAGVLRRPFESTMSKSFGN
jgi:hypothetical protein